MIGVRNFLARRTRPDIAASVGTLNQFSIRPSHFNINAGKQIFGYLKGTREYNRSILLSRNISQLKFFFISDFAADKTDQKSRIGWIGVWNKSLLTCSSRKQVFFSLSAAKPENVSPSECCSDFQGTLKLLSELEIIMDDTPVLHIDNTAAITWAENSNGMRKAKHIEIRYHFVRNLVEKETVKLVNINSEDNIAELLAKTLDTILFKMFRDLVGVKTIPAHAKGEC